MNLNFRKLGSGHPLIILHGLYGAGDNWLSIAKVLSGFCEVYLIDQRNHGSSPHVSEHNYNVLTDDIKEFLDQHGIEKTMILGHSMGGKVAMQFAIDYPHMLTKLIIVDISPGSYAHDDDRNHIRLHKSIIQSLMNVDLAKIGSLSDADMQMKEFLPDERLRKFLMKNLRKGEDHLYKWKINLPVLKDNISVISGGLDKTQMGSAGIRNFPVLFIRGANSDYIVEEDEILIKEMFPLSTLVTIKNAGHWLHAEQANTFAKIVKQFLIS
jgi:pimeloyl-ACP methyl ester carboxylesterase